ncbi:S41 family peptidase [Abyssalbus ytuae]|uniref:S41 family peptidase n=1 Tax=Abyssalbus ytuae TaxID=2926907 RepID=A0A9E6ZX64_9FLAO|nr:S41 family peptidase [Abyssalbus ytuae]UOB19393.1 S41 family peptidase [Abyssalbus ytuae]
MKRKFLVPVVAVVVLFFTVSFKNDFFEIAKQVEIFTTMFKELNMNYVDETNPAELMDTAIKSMLEDLDPYTRFMNEQDVEEYKIRNAGQYSGIGAIVRNFKDKLLIIEPYKGYAADLAGLKAGDEIIKIGNITVADFKEDASELLKGAVNSEVEITFKRQGKTHFTTIKREEIEVDAVPFYKKIDDETGYIVLDKFNRKASSQTEDALVHLKSQGAEKIILDLRGNPGGLLSEAINICNLFVPKDEMIVTTKSKVKKFNRTYSTKNEPVDTEIPLVVLIDGNSASASEIVSGALQDLDRAVVVGARSYGKGLVQRPINLTYGTQLKVTISRYFTPSGRCIQALDYWHRDENGNAVRTTQENYKEFTTRNGRKVYDGGGVMPDIEITSLKLGELAQEVVMNNVVFDYATDYYYSHPSIDLNNFSFDNTAFDHFKDFVFENGLGFDTKIERKLKSAIRNEDISEYGSEVEASYYNFLTTISTNKLKVLDQDKEGLQKDIEDEIIKRYHYREGLYEYYLSNDEAIKNSVAILADEKKYKEILH